MGINGDLEFGGLGFQFLVISRVHAVARLASIASVVALRVGNILLIAMTRHRLEASEAKFQNGYKDATTIAEASYSEGTTSIDVVRVGTDRFHWSIAEVTVVGIC